MASNNPTLEEAQKAGAICGALIMGLVWQAQQEAPPATLPIRRSHAKKKYLNARETAEYMGLKKSKFYDLINSDPAFPKKKQVAEGIWKYETAEIDRYQSKKLKA